MLVNQYAPVGNYAPTLGEDVAGAVERGLDLYLRRPYLNDAGVPCVNFHRPGRYTVEKGQRRPIREQVPIQEVWNKYGVMDPVFNAVSMRREDWIAQDAMVEKAFRLELSAWDDLARSSTVGGFDGWSNATYEYDAMSDPGEAIVDMEADTEGRTDSPLYKTRSVPLPVTHSDFSYTQRRMDIARKRTPLDTISAEAAGRRIGEMIEKTTIGVETGITFGTQTAGYGTHDGTSTVYGYTNFPYRITKTDLTTPTGSNPEAVVQDVLEMIETMQANGFNGPWALYHSTGYSIWLNSDYFRSGSTSAVRTLNERIMDIGNITSIRRLNYLTSGYQLVLVQLDSRVAQAINGMELRTVQWPSMGGMRQNFKVLCIKVPLLRAPYNGIAPIIHGTTS